MTLNFFGIPWESEIADRVTALLLANSILDYELKGEKISDKTACDILLSPVLAGGQGPGHIAALAIYHLTKHPSMLQRARAEVDQLRTRKEKLGETDLSVSDLKDLKYLTQVYNEVLRISHEFNGHVIPKGWFMLAPFVLVHMDPEIYPEPSKFNPDRFETPPNPGQFFPFGRGYRTCVGRNFTKLVVLMALYHIFSNFT
ncbi:hypothetical protein R1sor_025756 [Riccia sorocarpa]|uniref:Cytochrome P450 n=1 Tax=Riccia sorocarpa TaxID=122646 RepID=A0ABD3G9I3_9MARC